MEERLLPTGRGRDTCAEQRGRGDDATLLCDALHGVPKGQNKRHFAAVTNFRRSSDWQKEGNFMGAMGSNGAIFTDRGIKKSCDALLTSEAPLLFVGFLDWQHAGEHGFFRLNEGKLHRLKKYKIVIAAQREKYCE